VVKEKAIVMRNDKSENNSRAKENWYKIKEESI